MHQPDTDTWFMPDSLQVSALLSVLAAEFGVAATPEYSATVVYADSFDWRLFRQGYILHCHNQAWTLYHGDSGEITVQQGGPELNRSCFARDFPPGVLREVLAPLLAVRCLLPMATVTLIGHQIRLLNRDEKTVARVVFEEQRLATAQPVFRMLRLFGIRGYDQALHTVRRILEENGVTQPASPLIGFVEGCKGEGRQPLDYSSKFTMELHAGYTARQAMVRIYRQLLTAINQNIPGVIEDFDSEFLHDLRVAIRRTRSGLSLVKNVLPTPVVESFKKDFGILGSITGPTRDLDVYLLEQDDYLARLPTTLQPALHAFFEGLALRRQAAHKKMVRALQSKKSKAILSAWKHYLTSDDQEPASAAEVDIGHLSGRIIFRRFKRVMKDGKALDAATPDAEVHRLRIQCKKLRYAIEFFSSLYPVEEIALLVRQLKKLQDILGAFNDLSVQQEMLHRSLEGLRAGSHRNLEQAAALGGLMQSLFQQQQELRGHFAEAFAMFSDPQNEALFNRLFRNRQEPS
ncbi:MAG: CHAD domain-containing protein [Desulfobulbaceae bacterium]|nr:CHAD domain-containing protein [Desulfobulbaceae bacterium]